MTAVVEWIIRADRREADLARVQRELAELGQTLEGLSVTLAPAAALAAAPDGGAFRDFVLVGTARAQDVRVLEAMAEELLLDFGFLVDFLKA
jgi:hypothetical protein